MRIPASEAVRAAAARTLHAEALPSVLGFSTDTRTLEPGQTFVALRGERFDGHRFVAEALAKGAAGLVVDDPAAVPEDAAALVVADTTAAYLAFAGVARRRLSGRVVAITGSTGKTTTKAFTAQLLELAGSGSVAATSSNENNEIGVAKLFLGLEPEVAFVVVEFGARHYGEIVPLARVALPHVALLTNVGDAHLEIMGSRARLAETKWGIFATGAIPVLNARDAVSLERAASLDRPVTWFATRGKGEPSTQPQGQREVSLVGDELLVLRERDGERRFRTSLLVPGEHNRSNAAAAAAAALALGMKAEQVAGALVQLALPPGRYERIELGEVAMIFDAYNASMSGTIATLESFAHELARRRIAVLGSMAELGADAPAMHARVGAAAAASGLDMLLVGGEFAAELAGGARREGLDAERIVRFERNAEAVGWLRAHLRPGDLVLLKASRKYKLEEIVEGLRATRA
ncbi:MAG: UDP-N-acetylmuramoyl-tripeptide--D-alanyl-D-alanine ligase [Vulcanimicrobiaceae bacterium]